MDTPSELLTRAADLIRDTAAHFQPYVDNFDDDGRFDGPADDWIYYQVDRNASRDARRWIALLNPSIAPALEFWLRNAAEMVKPFDQGYTTSAYCAERGALAFAHVLLGLGTPEEAK